MASVTPVKIQCSSPSGERRSAAVPGSSSIISAADSKQPCPRADSRLSSSAISSGRVRQAAKTSVGKTWESGSRSDAAVAPSATRGSCAVPASAFCWASAKCFAYAWLHVSPRPRERPVIHTSAVWFGQGHIHADRLHTSAWACTHALKRHPPLLDRGLLPQIHSRVRSQTAAPRPPQSGGRSRCAGSCAHRSTRCCSAPRDSAARCCG